MSTKSESGTVEYSFDKKIYKPAAVKKAVEDYSGAALFDVAENKSAVRVSISGIPSAGNAELTGEFRNYVLYLNKIL
ncbi:MAG: HxsD-like protein [bacterium]